MDSSQISVALEDIDAADPLYRITTETGLDGLKASIAAVGLIHPPFLWAGGRGCVIVSGFRRVRACRNLGWKEMPARVFGSQTDGLALARLAVADNAGQRPLNLLESARSVALLARHVKDVPALAAEAGILGLSDSREMTRKLLTLSRLPRPVQAAVADATLSLPMALELGQYPEETALLLTGLFSQLKPSLNRQRELVELLREISRREETTVAAILREPQPAALLSDPDSDRNLTIRRLRDYLLRRRFPAISRAEADFERALKALPLGPGASMSAPKHFEGNAFTLTLSFRDRRELEKHRDALDGILQHAALGQIFR